MVQQFRLALALFALTLTPIVLQAETRSDIFDRMGVAQNAGYEDIDNYSLKTNTLEISTFEYFEKTASLQLENGTTVYVMRNVPPNEIQERQSGGDNGLSNMTADEMRLAAVHMEDAGRRMEDGMSSEIEGVGLPGGIGDMLMNPPEDQPWLSPNPRDMTSMYATMFNAAADGKDFQDAQDPVGDAERNAQSMAAIQDRTTIVGREAFKGIDAIQLAAVDLNYTVTEDGMTTTWNQVTMNVDANRYVPLLLTMEGVVNDGKESRPITVEREDMDYRNVPGCGDLYRPFKSVMRLGGALTPEQQAELAEASKQLEQLEAQMASMPANQRQMMENMMGPQLAMIKNMASGGGIEITSTITELRCNTGLPDPLEMATTMMGGVFTGGSAVAIPATGGGGAVNTEADLLKMIQGDLTRIGYEPGNTDGKLDKLTVVAISQFQASKGMEVTGQPSPQLAGILQAE